MRVMAAYCVREATMLREHPLMVGAARAVADALHGLLLWLMPVDEE